MAILIKRSILQGEEIKVKYRDEEGRLLIIEVKLYGQTFVIASAYAPNLPSDRYGTFQARLQEELLKCGGSRVIVAGDLNCMMSEMDGRGGRMKVYREVVEKWKQMLTRLDLTDIYRRRNEEDPGYTFYQKVTGGKTIARRLDYFMVSGALVGEVESIGVNMATGTDHSALEMVLRGQRVPVRSTLWKMNEEILAPDSEVRPKVDRAVEESLLLTNQHETSTMKWERFKMEVARKTKKICVERKKRKDKEKQELADAYEQARLRYATTGRDCDFEIMSKINCEFKEIARKEIQRLIVVTRSEKYEMDEKGTKYFHEKLKNASIASNIYKIEREEDGKVTETPTEIAEEVKRFWGNIAKRRKEPRDIDLAHKNKLTWQFLKGLPQLADYQKQMCEKDITLEEAEDIIMKLPEGKSPGNDGLPYLFYKTYWNKVGDLWLNMVNDSLKNGVFPKTTKTSVLKLLHKRGKNPLKTASWRPICLLNSCYKIYASVIANRLYQVTQDLISDKQTAFTKGRKIDDNNLSIDIVIQEMVKKGKGCVITVDFYKAFDSLDHDFIWKTLEAYGFPKRLVDFIKLAYNKTEVAVFNQGRSWGNFTYERGCKQGDQLSTHIFVLAVEVLLRMVHKDLATEADEEDIGVTYNAYADDLSVYVYSKEAVVRLERILEAFKKISGLGINPDKCEMLIVGGLEENQVKKVANIPYRLTDEIKVTGVYHRAEYKKQKEVNYAKRLEIIKCKIKMLKMRGLTFMGKVHAIKSLLQSQDQFLLTTMTPPESYIKDCETEIYRYLWGGSEKISRNALQNDHTDGGINRNRLDIRIAAAAVRLYLRAFDVDLPWTRLFRKALKEVQSPYYIITKVNGAAIEKNVGNVCIKTLTKDASAVRKNPGNDALLHTQIKYNCEISIVNKKEELKMESVSAALMMSDLFMEDGVVMPIEEIRKNTGEAASLCWEIVSAKSIKMDGAAKVLRLQQGGTALAGDKLGAQNVFERGARRPPDRRPAPAYSEASRGGKRADTRPKALAGRVYGPQLPVVCYLGKRKITSKNTFKQVLSIIKEEKNKEMTEKYRKMKENEIFTNYSPYMLCKQTFNSAFWRSKMYMQLQLKPFTRKRLYAIHQTDDNKCKCGEIQDGEHLLYRCQNTLELWKKVLEEMPKEFEWDSEAFDRAFQETRGTRQYKLTEKVKSMIVTVVQYHVVREGNKKKAPSEEKVIKDIKETLYQELRIKKRLPIGALKGSWTLCGLIRALLPSPGGLS